ncbi:translation initiation factor IF-2 [Geminocystis sp. GBBB08]|uniref:translation initiation factor IF-2 n=1 Tax=Geminocystis sp. GBBB08 TaxID=2604140 RepID=UPI0027E30A46|nr:translation initiation factor IF-2 [Geminocystis sp. GBBB08]MBL1209686.1 translation initiation factor IF-2 [Geminocystis sp. GBBB08]
MKNGKIRIYDLSKELGLDNKDVLDICTELSIDVKNHSSTITETQAENIKEAAKNHHMTSANHQVKKNINKETKNSPTPDLKPKNKKPEILAIYASNVSEASNSEALKESPTLLSPPRPQMPTSSEANSSSPVKVTETTAVTPPKELKGPPPRPQINKGNKPAAKSIPITHIDKSKENNSKKLSLPISEKNSSLNSSSSNEDKRPKPKINNKTKINTSRRFKNGQRRQEGEENVEIRDQESTLKPVKKPLTIREENMAAIENKSTPKPKLHRPPQRPVAVIEPDLDLDDDLEDKSLTVDDDFEPEPIILLEKPTRTKQKPKKLLNKSEEATWEDDDDSKEGKKAVKKRRSLLIDDDDDDFNEDFEEDDFDSEMLNLALARPDKPLSEQPKPPEKNRFPRRQKPKFDKTEQRQDKKVKSDKEQLPEFIVLRQNPTLRDLAELLNTPDTEIIKLLFFKGIAVNITETLDIEIAKMVASDLGVEIITEEEKASAVKTEMIMETDLDKLQHRPPVVTIMGHVDHGKTTLLDSIRNTKVVQGEAGGITQHIGAYHVDVEHEGKTQQIVFLDTPGHEAFTAMRARGAKVTDIAVLVVAADDGVRPQTKEAISHARAAKVPIVVAINKIDKADANPDRVKQELVDLQLVPEDWGGDTVMVPVSALNGQNLDNLLEMIVLVSEMEELSANPDRPAKGTVIEAHLDRARGPVATLLVQNGTLRVGDIIVAGSVSGKIRAMIDDRGNKVEAATPSFAVEILGLNEVPAAGDEFDVYKNEKEAKAIAENRASEQRDTRLQQAMSSRRVTLSTLSAQAQQGELKELNLILKADVQGSVEAILGSLKQLPQKEVQIRVLLSTAGEITETDVDLAAASGAIILGFNTTLAPNARQAAEQEGVDIREYNVIYKLLDEIEGAMEGLLDPEEVEESLGTAQVRAVFSVGKGAVAGCYVTSGKVLRNRFIRVLRNNQIIYSGNLDSLRRVKDDVKEVAAGFECGIAINKCNEWQGGDNIEAYEMVFKRRTLTQ